MSAFSLFTGIPLIPAIVLSVLLAVALGAVAWTLLLVVLAARERRRRRRADRTPRADESDFMWVFVVPAMDEEVTIADSVGRLADVRATHRRIVVVDDASADATPTVLAGLDVPDLRVVRRELPEARIGKAAVLDLAWRMIGEELAGVPRDRVIVGVVDADGRLDPGAPSVLAQHFADPRVGGVQTLVRIYNQTGYLTWAQGLEFSVFGRVMQLARSWWGTANMGGNGQFNRLSALDDLVVDEQMPEGVARGPWRDKLTEDQDLGVRMVQAGWRGEQTNAAVVEQQGVPNLRRLYRQRTRWAQGGWQVVPDVLGVRRMRHVSLVARLDAVMYLLTPVVQAAVAVGMTMTFWYWVVEDVAILPRVIPAMVLFVVAALGPAPLGVLLRGGTRREVATALIVVLPYMLYSLITYPVVWRALGRQLLRRHGWAKTAREPIVVDDGPRLLPDVEPERLPAV
ncbi:cellulose synthase/poly-beta-1,6-N-acetylglucosamine synthase-like glycosyltransferase [Sediminihabitans luteus]|uniref:Cellulose synthase/poly-beta-1,6-N-acetylglucosamine synthase-like glycosyltransferase n=1 Tax=Sediminihabitans luteus TaxID=1138585 RepID=A0A2M9D062_9CELL|nr:glycosyltransferase family 2 protein [Sediminihabitans luteus]PJJ77586.1 cellulose synthase/poly-beta-1,6-N-acetylglucosamine synthase-like glycosyltransferase [Sediminihabitans luteus]GII98486.1 N-acetyl-glucosamine transferase [Sediminihabitans luteus]